MNGASPLPSNADAPRAIRRFFEATTVPKRFSIGAFLAITTIWAVMVLGLRQARAPYMLFYFFGIELCLVCLAQMRFERSPRWASTLVGAILMYVVVVIAALSPGPRDRHYSRFFIASQIVGFWAADNYMVFLYLGLRPNDVWISPWGDEIAALLFSLGVGGAYGYALGTFAAGIFLLGNLLQGWLIPSGSLSDSNPQPFGQP